nr:hypothetical protein [uncultured Azospirillum sp.]
MRRSSQPPCGVVKTPMEPIGPPSVALRLWPALPPQTRHQLALEMAGLFRRMLAPVTPEIGNAERDVRR